MSKQYVDMNTPVIEMRNITKKFGDFVANDGINLTVHKGEIHAILGENGAGKSTLMKILTGVYTRDAGTVLVDGQEVNYKVPALSCHACMRRGRSSRSVPSSSRRARRVPRRSA